MAFFTQRFNFLREKMRPPGRDRALTAVEISNGVEQVTGQKISASVIAYYIRGERQPSLEYGALLARYFGVPTSYWTDEDVSHVDRDVENFQKIKELKRANVERIAARLGDFTANLDALSDVELEMLDAILERFRAVRADDEKPERRRRSSS